MRMILQQWNTKKYIFLDNWSFLLFRNDLLQISHGTTNDTLIAKATNIGQTIFKVNFYSEIPLPFPKSSLFVGIIQLNYQHRDVNSTTLTRPLSHSSPFSNQLITCKYRFGLLCYCIL